MAPAFAVFYQNKQQRFCNANRKRSLLGVGPGIEATRLLYDLKTSIENERGERRGIWGTPASSLPDEPHPLKVT